MADERAPNSCPSIEFRLEREDHDDMINPALNPLHTPRPPSPNLRCNVVQHTSTSSFGNPGEMKVQPRVIDQHDKIPGLCLQHPSDGAHTLNHSSDRRQPNQPHHVQLWNARHKFHTRSTHPRPTNSDQLGRWIERHNCFG